MNAISDEIINLTLLEFNRELKSESIKYQRDKKIFFNLGEMMHFIKILLNKIFFCFFIK